MDEEEKQQMKACPELIVTPCKACDAHVMSFLCYDDRGHAVITCPTCKSVLFDKLYNEVTDIFIKNQRSYYAMAAELMPEFRELNAPGDRVKITDAEKTPF
jgi:hypothetical protein